MGLMDFLSRKKVADSNVKKDSIINESSNVKKESIRNDSHNNDYDSGKVSLSKCSVSLNKTLVSLSKNSNVDLCKHRAKVGVAIDRSGSMETRYNKGEVQDTLTRLLPLAIKFDDNGELDVWAFNSKADRLEGMTEDNYSTYVNDNIKYVNGGTNYSPVLNDAYSKYFVEEYDANLPTFLIYITDGENNDLQDTIKTVDKLKDKNIFTLFIGIGNETFSNLKTLIKTNVKNIALLKVKDFKSLSDDSLYELLIEDYLKWLANK